jgi:hypothetical protein
MRTGTKLCGNNFGEQMPLRFIGKMDVDIAAALTALKAARI